MKVFSNNLRPSRLSSEDRVRELVADIACAEAELQEILGEEIDAIVAPSNGAPVMLRKAQEALRASENRYRRLTDRLSAIVFELTPDGTVLFVNEAVAEITGYRPEELNGRNWWETFFPDEQQRFAEELLRLCRREDVTHLELPLQARNGSEVILDLNSANHYAPDGTLERIVGIGIDISEKKQSETERERLIAELDATIGALPGGLIIYSPTGEILRINAKAARIFGYSEQDLARSMAERAGEIQMETPDAKPLALAETPPWKALRELTPQKRTIILRNPDGHRTWVACSAAPIKSNDGRLIGAVATFNDITEVHELQRQRDTYIHTISHDLRNPLTLVQGYGQLLEARFNKESGQEDALQQVGFILESARKMSTMIEDLVDSARLSNGRLKLKKRRIKLCVFIENLLQQYQSLLEPARIEVEISEELPPVFADPDRFERILLNLLTNALKYSPLDAKVTIEAHRDDGQVSIAVIDRGQGIAAEDLPHIFKRSYQPRGERRPDSVGLGLFITRHLVEAHGGHIRVDSTAGRGSTFTLSLPTG